MELKDKKALITGGSEGLGLFLAKVLIERGCQVNILARRADKLKAARDSINSVSLKSFVCDVSNYDQVEKTVAEVGSIDILINNAGIWLEGLLAGVDPQAIKKVIDVNLTGMIYVTRAALPGMLKRNEGFILNVSSTSGLEARDGQTVYAASKWGVRGFTESLKLELAKTNVNVFGFYPGGMNTTLFKKAGFSKDVSAWMDTNKVAQLLATLMETDENLLPDQLVLKKRKVLKS